MKKLFVYIGFLAMTSCNGQDVITKGITTSAEKIPLTDRDFYQDNNYTEKPGALIDGNTTTSFVPAWNLIYLPHDVVVDLSDYNATVKKIRIYDSHGDGFNTKLILVRKDNEEEVEVASFTGDRYNQWVEFTPPAIFVASRFIMRGGANNGYGNELELLGSYTKPVEAHYNRPRQPLKNMLGVNAHWWDFLTNVNTKETSIVPAKYNAFLDLGLTSLRNYGNAKEYQPLKGKWAFNPVRQGWYEEELMKQLEKDRPGLVKWSVLQGPFDFVRESWNVPDDSRQFTATVQKYVNHGTWGVLVLRSVAHKGSGQFNNWHIELAGAAPAGKAANDFKQTSNTQATIPNQDPSKVDLVVAGNLPYKEGQKVVVKKGQSSELNLYYADNHKRSELATWQVLGDMAFVAASRKGTNTNAPAYGVWSHVDYDPEHAQWIAKNEMLRGTATWDLFEGMNEPNAFWAGYDNFLNGRFLAPAWSMMYDGHKGLYPKSGVKNADPHFKMSTSGLATASTDIMREVYWWSKKNRGFNKDSSVNLPFDIVQFHNYSYTGGLSQYAGGVQGGLPPELSNVLDAVDEFVWFSNKYAGGREVWCGEWGYDVHPESPMNAPAYGPYTAEQTRGAWAVRTILEFSAHGLDRAQWYRLYQDGNTADNDATQFSTMSLLRENEDKTISRRLVGDYFKQMGELGEFVFESRVADHPRVLKFRNGKQVLYAIWAVEKMDLKKGQRPRFTETTGSYTLSLPGVRSITVKNLADGAGAMHSQQVSLTNESYPVNYSAKPVFVIYTEN